MTMDTVADFVEHYAEQLLTLGEDGKVGINEKNIPFLREVLIELFKQPHVLTAKALGSGTLIPGRQYVLLDKSIPQQPNAVVLEEIEPKEFKGQYCISFEDFINAFSENEIPEFKPTTSLEA